MYEQIYICVQYISKIGRFFCTCSYADWYKPQPKWAQDPLVPDDELADIVNFDIPQPTSDITSLCTGFVPQSSSDSMRWIKIPCDYPLFAAGVICKQPVPVMTSETNTSESL